MSSKNGDQRFVEVVLGDGTLSPTFQKLPAAEAYTEHGTLKPDHELVRLARAQFDRTHPLPARPDSWDVYIKALAKSLPATPEIRQRLPRDEFEQNLI